MHSLAPYSVHKETNKDDSECQTDKIPYLSRIRSLQFSISQEFAMRVIISKGREEVKG